MGLNELNGKRGDGRRESGKAHGLFEKKKGFNETCSLTLDFNNLSKCNSGKGELRKRVCGVNREEVRESDKNRTNSAYQAEGRVYRQAGPWVGRPTVGSQEYFNARN